MNKTTLVEIAGAKPAIAFSIISFVHSGTPTTNQQAILRLKDLSRIISANADGYNPCGDAGTPCTPCTITLNGYPARIYNHKNY